MTGMGTDSARGPVAHEPDGDPAAAARPDLDRRGGVVSSGTGRAAATLLGAAGLIAGITVLARSAGFGRIVVFTGTVGYTPVGDVYQAVNTLPNIVFEIVAGGALASVVVPLLAGAVDRGDRDDVNRTTSALLTWTLGVLAPLALGLALAAGPVVNALLGPGADDADREFGRFLLLVFAPQIPLYGIGIVLAGVLQAHHRFVGPAVAPLLSSLTVIGAYLLYAAVGGAAEPAALSTTAALVLSVGTTLGVVVLSLGLLVPLRGTGVRLRPALRFPTGAAPRARRLVASGVAAVMGQQLALLVALSLALRAPAGSVVAFTVAQTLFLLPWAVLAVPVATSAFPRLTAAWARGDADAYRRTLRSATRTVLVVSAAGAAALAGAAEPVAAVVTALGGGEGNRDQVAAALVLFAPGLLGYALLALLTRALAAAGAAWPAALATLAGWTVVVVADLVAVALVPVADRVPALAAGNTVGMTAAGLALLALVPRTAGPGTLAGVARVAVASIVAATLAAGAGRAVTALPGRGTLAAVGEGLLAGLVVLVVFGAVAVVLEPAELRPAARRVAHGLRRRVAPGSATAPGMPPETPPGVRPGTPPGEHRGSEEEGA
jgi:putative peptidoglycan lipid II flippase